MPKKEKEKVVDQTKNWKYIMTIRLASGKIVDVYEVSPNVSRFIFREEEKEDIKKKGGYKLVPE
jgi:major membrane immunogen (membrane-anchored lipoprotein)